jgi:hypothetical protein
MGEPLSAGTRCFEKYYGHQRNLCQQTSLFESEQNQPFRAAFCLPFECNWNQSLGGDDPVDMQKIATKWTKLVHFVTSSRHQRHFGKRPVFSFFCQLKHYPTIRELGLIQSM